MSVSSRASELQIPKKWRDRDNTSPERNIVWTEPPRSDTRVPVVYYLSRNGLLDQPHFMQVPLSSPHGLFLPDVINRLIQLRGKGLANVYSWSSKRSYKNSFVWHDLAENDFIYPSHAHEYVLKGSELLDSPETTQSTPQVPPESLKSGEDPDFPPVRRRRNQSWAAIDLQEYRVYKTESAGDSTRQPAADAATQTDERRRRRSAAEESREACQSTELNREEVSPPLSDSSPETLESLLKADGRLILNRTAGNCPSGRMKASSVVMQFLSCGSMSFRDCGVTAVKDQGLSLVSQRRTVSRGGTSLEIPKFSGVKLEDKEYFSGSLIETRKEQFPTLKRSSSYNADRSSQLPLMEREVGGTRAKCVARGLPAGKECNSRSDEHGSKRLTFQL